MDLAPHARTEGRIHELVPGKAALSCKLAGYDNSFEMHVVVAEDAHLGTGKTGSNKSSNF